MIKLTDEEALGVIKETTKIQREHKDVMYGDVWLVQYVAKAQLKKVGEWGDTECGHRDGLTNRQCEPCWQALLEEIKE